MHYLGRHIHTCFTPPHLQGSGTIICQGEVVKSDQADLEPREAWHHHHDLMSILHLKRCPVVLQYTLMGPSGTSDKSHLCCDGSLHAVFVTDKAVERSRDLGVGTRVSVSKLMTYHLESLHAATLHTW